MEKVTFKPFDRVLARNLENSPWNPDIFLRMSYDGGLYICARKEWRICIPYDEAKYKPEFCPFKKGDRLYVQESNNTQSKAVFLQLDVNDMNKAVVWKYTNGLHQDGFHCEIPLNKCTKGDW